MWSQQALWRRSRVGSVADCVYMDLFILKMVLRTKIMNLVFAPAETCDEKFPALDGRKVSGHTW